MKMLTYLMILLRLVMISELIAFFCLASFVICAA